MPRLTLLAAVLMSAEPGIAQSEDAVDRLGRE